MGKIILINTLAFEWGKKQEEDNVQNTQNDREISQNPEEKEVLYIYIYTPHLISMHICCLVNGAYL